MSKKITFKEFFNLHKEAKTYDEVETLLNRLRKDTREKYDKAYFDCGEATRRTGQNYAVILQGVRRDMGGKIDYSFRAVPMYGLDPNALTIFLEEQLELIQLIRYTWTF